MASLTEVVEELKGQNDTLEDVKSALKGMLDIDLQNQKDAETQELQDKEAAIEARKSKAKVSTKPPQTFGAGLSKGLGLDALTGGIRGLLGPFLGSLGGVFGGLTVGGLLGAAIGNLFRLGVGALLGKEYITPLFEKYLPTWLSDFELFGEGEDALKVSDVGGYVTGAAALLFGPKILGQLISKGFGSLGRTIFGKTKGLKGDDFIGPQQKENIGKRVKGRAKMFGAGLVRNIGLAGILSVAGQAVGDGIANITGSETLGTAISQSAEWAAIGALFFGPAGAITLGLASLAVSGLTVLGEYFRNQDKKIREDAYKALEPYDDMTTDEIRNMTEVEREEFTDKAFVALNESKRAMSLMISDAEREFNEKAKIKAEEIISKVATEQKTNLDYGSQITALMNEVKRNPEQSTPQLERLAKDLLMSGETEQLDIERYVGMFLNTGTQGIPTASDTQFQSTLVEMISSAISRLTNPYVKPLPELPMRPLGSEPRQVMEPFGAPLGQSRIDQPGGFPAPMGLGNSSSISAIQPNQTIDAESALVAGNQNSMVFAPNNSDNRRTIINRAGDSPMRLAPIKSSTDDNFLSKRDRLMGLGAKVGNSFP